MERGNECSMCGSVEFELSCGLFFCSECGTQSQDVREEVAVEDENSGTYFRALSTRTKKNATSDSVQDGGPQMVTHLEKLQFVLQMQCDALVALGCESSIKECVRLIWFQYLKHFHYAFEDPDTLTFHHKTEPLTNRYNVWENSSHSKPKVPQSSIKYPFLQRKRPGEQLIMKGNTKLLRQTKIDSHDDVSTHSIQEADTIETLQKSPATSQTSKLDEEKPSDILTMYPNDDYLFQSSDSELSDKEKDVESSGFDLYLKRRRLPTRGLAYFGPKHAVSLCYLGLLYSQQNILVSDLSRWTRLNKVPYNNLVQLLSDRGYDSRFAIAVSWPLTAERIYNLASSLYVNLPLPAIPTPDISYICHTLLDRLSLSVCFHTLIDRALSCLQWPNFEESFGHRGCPYGLRQHHIDGECMALIVMLVVFLYKLDDAYEFQQPLLAETSEEPCDSSNVDTLPSQNSSNFLYVWEDWVVLFCEYRASSLHKSVPLTQRELDYVRDYHKYLDFCRLELFRNSRPRRTSKLSRYNPDFYSEISCVFGAICDGQTALQQPIIEHADQQKKGPINPRKISMETLLSDPYAPWKKYSFLYRSTPEKIRRMHVGDLHVSKSLQFLLKVCSELVDISVTELYLLVLRVEQELYREISSVMK